MNYTLLLLALLFVLAVNGDMIGAIVLTLILGMAVAIGIAWLKDPYEK